MAEAKRTRRTLKPPSYRLHKASGQARVRLNGGDVYLGPFGSEESRQRYAKLIAEHASGTIHDRGKPILASDGLMVCELVAAYIKFATKHYVKNGRPTDELSGIKAAMRPLVKLYAKTTVNEFGPLALKAVRQSMIDSKKKCRGYINQSIGRIRRCFKWGVENEQVKPETLVGLQAVAPLLAGRCDAKDHPRRHAVSDENIELVKSVVAPMYRDMIDLARFTGARPGELVKLTSGMIDKKTYASQGVWIASLTDHKTAHRGKSRVIVFGPRCQAVLLRCLQANPDERLFPVRRDTFSNNIKAACDRLKIPRFTGHWLRHTAGKRIRDEYGLDSAQVTLGHASANITELYSELDVSKAVAIAKEAG